MHVMLILIYWFDPELKPPAAGLKGDSFFVFLGETGNFQSTLSFGLARTIDRDQSILFCFTFTLLPVYTQNTISLLETAGLSFEIRE